MIHELRQLVSIELYENTSYYASHPLLKTKFEEDNTFLHFHNLFTCVLSENAFNVFDKTNISLSIQTEAESNLVNCRWSSFLCVLALSSVIGRPINCHYPSVGEKKYHNLFNCLVQPKKIS